MGRKYSLETLLDDVQNGFDELNDKAKANDKAKREIKHKFIIIQMLANLAQKYGGEEYDDVKLYEALVGEVNKNGLLSGFLFFVSQNPQFDYSWNYMRKQKVSYAYFLVDAIRFLNNVVADVNVLAADAMEVKEIHVMINELFDVELGNVEPFVKTRVKWENFQRIAAFKKDYRVSVCKEDNTLAMCNRRDAEDVAKLKAEAMERLGESKKSTK